MMTEKVKINSLRPHDPEGIYYSKVRELAEWHYATNPDGLESVRAFNKHKGVTALIQHLIDKEYNRKKVLNQLNNT